MFETIRENKSQTTKYMKIYTNFAEQLNTIVCIFVWFQISKIIMTSHNKK